MKKAKETLTPMMQQYWGIKANYPGVILLFRLGDFYEMFGDDAIKAAPIMEVVLTKRGDVPMCGVPHHALNMYLHKLISKGHKAAICEQLEEAGVSKGITKRGVTRVITPGTILEDALLESKQNNYLISVFFDETNFQAAFAAADISTGDFFASESDMDKISAEIAKYSPSEVIISSKNLQNPKISDLLSKLKCHISEVNNEYFESNEIIEEVFGKSAAANAGILDNKTLAACASLLSYIKANQPAGVTIFSRIKYLNNSDFMFLDATAIKNLEILQSLANGKSENSLLSVVDSTNTSMGSRVLRQWLVKPLMDAGKIQNRQSAVQFFIDNSQIRKDISEKLKGVADIERILARITTGAANPKEIVSLKDSLLLVKDIEKIIKSSDGLNIAFPDNSSVVDKISNTLAQEPPVNIKDGNVIKSGIAPELDELRKLATDTKTFISELEAKEKAAVGISNLKIGYTSVFGYYIEITKSNVHLAPQHYVRKQTVTNGERYITQELKQLEEKILSSQEKILRLENDLFSKLKLELSLFARDILTTAQIISEIDVFAGFAQNAVDYDYSKPKITEGTDLEIFEGRHPVVERILKNGEFTANNVAFNEDCRVLILTGPNMSGKSTYLRQTALITIMAQIGSFVPAKSAKIGLVDRIFTRIGAGDNLAGGESTFMVEMTETANILNQYTKNSLIILDEVGRGTSTYDGMSIAWSVIEFFADLKKAQNLGSKILFATHYFELTGLAEQLKGIKNFSVAVKEWNGDVVFLHKIVEGSADKSYGIHVAKIAGIPHAVIERAYQILGNLEENQIGFEKKTESVQTELFGSLEPQILVELKKLNADALSPIEAFNIIRDWKKKYK